MERGTLAREQPTTWLVSTVVSLGPAAAQEVWRQGPGAVFPQLRLEVTPKRVVCPNQAAKGWARGRSGTQLSSCGQSSIESQVSSELVAVRRGPRICVGGATSRPTGHSGGDQVVDLVDRQCGALDHAHVQHLLQRLGGLVGA